MKLIEQKILTEEYDVEDFSKWLCTNMPGCKDLDKIKTFDNHLYISFNGKQFLGDRIKFKFVFKDIPFIVNWNILEDDKNTKCVDVQVGNQHTKMYAVDELLVDSHQQNEFIDELKEIFIPKDELFKDMPYQDVAIKCKMETANKIDPSGTFRSLYSKRRMAYTDSFPYNDIFEKNADLRKLLNSSIKKINELTDSNIKINGMWVYKKDPSLYLISMPQFNFLTTEEMLSQDIEKALKR